MQHLQNLTNTYRVNTSLRLYIGDPKYNLELKGHPYRDSYEQSIAHQQYKRGTLISKHPIKRNHK